MAAPVRVSVIGAAGRLGGAITSAAENGSEVVIVGRCGRGDAISSCVADCDVVIDVSTASAAEEICRVCVEQQKPLVIGTTGHSAEQMRAIENAATKIAVVLAPNFSVGVNTLFWLTRKAAELLGAGFDIEIVEAHHRLKKDAPSGTAKRLAELLCEVRDLDYERDVAHGRQGMVGERSTQQIGIHAIRAGDIVGEHTVVFAGAGERVELTHRASSRDTFALGALRAARWIANQPPALYSMEHVLGLNRAE